MKIAILQTGKTNPLMPDKFQDYPALFTDMFASDPRTATGTVLNPFSPQIKHHEPGAPK